MQDYVEKLVALDGEIVQQRARLDDLHAQKVELQDRFKAQLKEYLERLQQSADALFTQETMESEAKIIQYSQQYHHSNFAILSNAKLTIQLIQARTQMHALKSQIATYLGKQEVVLAIKAVCATFKASSLLDKDFLATQQEALTLLDDFAAERRRPELFQAEGPVMLYILARWHSTQDFLSAYTLSTTSVDIPPGLSVALRLMSQVMQTSTDEVKSIFKVLNWAYQDRYYHELTYIFHRKRMFCQFLQDLANTYISSIVGNLARFLQVFETSQEEPVFKIQSFQTAILLLGRYYTLLQQEEGKTAKIFEDAHADFMMATYALKEIALERVLIDKKAIREIIERICAAFQDETQKYLDQLLAQCVDADLLGNQLLSALQFVKQAIADIGQATSGIKDLPDLGFAFAQIASGFIEAHVAEFSLQAAYYLHAQLPVELTSVKPQLQAQITVQITRQAEGLLARLSAQMYKFIALQDGLPLVEAFEAVPALSQKSPWFSRFCDIFFTKMNESLYQDTRRSKVKNLAAASASINIMQAKCTEIMHVGSAPYFAKLRQMLQICAAVTLEEVALLVEEGGAEWLIGRDEALEIARAQGIE